MNRFKALWLVGGALVVLLVILGLRDREVSSGTSSAAKSSPRSLSGVPVVSAGDPAAAIGGRPAETGSGHAVEPSRRPRTGDEIVEELQALAAEGRPMANARIIMRLDAMTAEEAPHAFGFLADLNAAGEDTPEIWHTFWARWGLVGTEAALAQAAAGVPNYPESDRVTKQIFGGLATEDPWAAANFILEHPDLRERHRAVEGMSARWSRVDPGAATRFALEHLDGLELGNAMFAIPWGISATQGHEAALAWWRTLPTGKVRADSYGALSQIYRGRSRAEAEDRILLAEEGLAHGIRNEPLLAQVGTELAGDPGRGIRLLTRTPPPAGEDAAYYAGIDSLFSVWGIRDSVAAAESLSENLGEPWVDTGILGYARALAQNDPSAAAGWVAQIRDDGVRARWKR